ncbi:metallophosphoesterase [Limibacter armeniacum]|uniref:metallophosphoesterase n=1 Tax=Limibacter armeniacum TaxID=466084 RepID=UPI002FE53D42
MKTKVLRYLKHIFLTLLVLGTVTIMVGLQMGAAVNYGDDPARMHLDKEGPYIFFEADSLISVNYIKGNKEAGFYVNRNDYETHAIMEATCFFPLDSSYFNFSVKAEIKIPAAVYNDHEPIIALSDIEGGYKTFRDFLIHNKVIDHDLNWTFGKGHLVLVGDFVDRGWSVTQVLWFIYKLETAAEKHGGKVHYILGNHELKNMQGRYEAASPRYFAAAAILGKQHHQLYDSNSFIGRWMASKNAVEKINGYLFVHGGIHPNVAKYEISLEEINHKVRKHYYHIFFPKPEETVDQLLISDKKGVSWYRGYFKEDLTTPEIDSILKSFHAKSIVVGHTLQPEIKTFFEGRVVGIDVKHPKDYRKTWPFQDSEGLLIEGNKLYRLFSDGSRLPL